MKGFKGIFQSRAIMSGFAGMLAVALGLIGYNVAPEAIQGLVVTIMSVATFVTTALQILFRAVANKRLIADDVDALNDALKKASLPAPAAGS